MNWAGVTPVLMVAHCGRATGVVKRAREPGQRDRGRVNADVDGDGAVTLGDIDPFVALLSG